MDSRESFIVSLRDALHHPVSQVGGKTRNLSRCMANGFLVPDGFAITVEGYRQYVADNHLHTKIEMEIFRKPFEEMRWEEIWDIALRIRASFIQGTIHSALKDSIMREVSRWPEDTLFAVRSSSPVEDSLELSFAGVHDSYLNVPKDEIIEKIQLVWASLWSDRSLLYRKEKKLNSRNSVIAVLIQPMQFQSFSGLAFTADPATGKNSDILLEVIEGTLDQLVDNIVEPWRASLHKTTGTLKPIGRSKHTFLTPESVRSLLRNLLRLEALFGKPIDVEWTGTEQQFTVLQVRPITTLKQETDKERSWYLTLTPGPHQMLKLADRVEYQLIPRLVEDIQRFAQEDDSSDVPEILAEKLKIRGMCYQEWKKIYWDEFIPFAHGIRTFGTYYNDLIKPEDPYAFTFLLRSDNLLANQRDQRMNQLSQYLRKNPAWMEIIRKQSQLSSEHPASWWIQFMKEAGISEEFIHNFQDFVETEMSVYYENVSLGDDLGLLLQVLLSMAQGHSEKEKKEQKQKLDLLEEQYYQAAGSRRDEATNWLRIGRLSWKLRDDDNILLGKLEHQLLRYMKKAMKLLLKEGRLEELPRHVVLEDWEILSNALIGHQKVILSQPQAVNQTNRGTVKPRQLVGQPSSPGFMTGRARVVHSIEQFKDIKPGEVLVFDAVQPQMTFIISLAGGIVERRGGMLVHSSIIARELGIPAVNGVSHATQLIETGDLVSINGDLGLVLIGEPEFDLENIKKYE